MSQGDLDTAFEPDDGAVQGVTKTGSALISTMAPYLRRGARSGALAGVGGGMFVLRGVRSLRRGDYARGVKRLFTGAMLIAVAVAQQRDSTGVDQTDVVNTSPDLDDTTTKQVDQNGQHATGDEAAAVVGSSADIEDAGESPEVDSDGAPTDIDRTDVDRTDIAETGLDETDREDAADDVEESATDGDEEDTESTTESN